MTKKIAGQRRGRLYRMPLELPQAGAMLREAGFVSCDEDPIAAHMLCTRGGRGRRVHAQYSNGWRATLKCCADGSQALSQALRQIARKADA